MSPPASSPAKPGMEKASTLDGKGQGPGSQETETPPGAGATFSAHILEAWRLIIRPPRRIYGNQSLGPEQLQVILPAESSKKRLSRPLLRQELELKNGRGHVLKCSHFVFCESVERAPCVIFCHGSSSCRVDAFQIMPYLFEHKLTVFAFDFSGSGLSGGDYVTLGYREEEDLRVVIDYLSHHEMVSSIGLWGKSMGAVASILRASKDRRVDACVLDSPFGNFQRVVEDYCNQSPALQWVPQSAVDFCLARVCQAVKERVGLDPRQMKPVKVAPQCHCPALFAVAEGDCVVQPGQVEELEAAWNGNSRFCLLPGGHNTDRPMEFLQEAALFMAEALKKAEEADALLSGAVDLYLSSTAGAAPLHRVASKQLRHSRSVSKTMVPEEALYSAIGIYLDQRKSLDDAIDDFLSGGGSIPEVSSPVRWPHLTQGHLVQALNVKEEKRIRSGIVDPEGSSCFSI